MSWINALHVVGSKILSRINEIWQFKLHGLLQELLDQNLGLFVLQYFAASKYGNFDLNFEIKKKVWKNWPVVSVYICVYGGLTFQYSKNSFESFWIGNIELFASLSCKSICDPNFGCCFNSGRPIWMSLLVILRTVCVPYSWFDVAVSKG